MSGVFRFDKDESWVVASWVWRHVVRVLKTKLPRSSAIQFYEQIDTSEQSGLLFVDLEDVPASEIEAVAVGLKKTFEESKAAGEESFASPEFYAGFLERCGELLATVEKYVSSKSD